MLLSKILPQTLRNFTQIYLPYLRHYETLAISTPLIIRSYSHIVPAGIWPLGNCWQAMMTMVMVVAMMGTPGNAVVEHGEDEEGRVEAGEHHQEVVESVPHAEQSQ